MAQWTFVMEYVDQRDIRIEADTEEEARAKMEAGQHDIGETICFFESRVLYDLKPVGA